MVINILKDKPDMRESDRCKPKLKSGYWKVEYEDTVSSAEAELRFKEIRGAPQFGRADLGLSKSSPTPKEKHSR